MYLWNMADCDAVSLWGLVLKHSILANLTRVYESGQMIVMLRHLPVPSSFT